MGTSYTYDATGNRTSKTIGGTTYSNTIAADSNRMTQVSDVGGTAAVSHDAAGHVTSEGAITFGYDDRGRMATASNAGGTVTYSYNGLEQRARKTGPSSMVPTGAAYYVYDEQGQILGEYDANGVPRYETVYLATTPVGVMKQAGTPAGGNIAVTLYNVHADQIDTPRVITRQDHTIVWRWDVAEAFGATVPDQNPSGLGAFVFNQRFPGQVFDAETGLFQNWHREYNARWGRYVQSDPIGLQGGINTFAYVSGDPLRYVDPTGEVGLLGAGYGAVAGGIGGYISGGWKGAAYGAGAGALVGAVNPWASHWAGGAAGAASASLLGQAAGNFATGKSLTEICNYDLTAAAGAAAGGALGGPVNGLVSRYGPQFVRSEIGREVGSKYMMRSPAMTLGAAAEGAVVGAGELAGTGRCTCSR